MPSILSEASTRETLLPCAQEHAFAKAPALSPTPQILDYNIMQNMGCIYAIMMYEHRYLTRERLVSMV